MKKPFHLILVMILGGLVLLVMNQVSLELIKEGSLQKFWWNFCFAILANVGIIAICSIFVYHEGVRRGTGRLLQPEYLRAGKRFKITNSFFDLSNGCTYVTIFMGFYHRICKIPYKLPEDATHLRVVEIANDLQFEPINVVPEDVRVLTP